MIILVAIFLLLFFFIAWRRLDWAVFIIIAALPSYLIRFQVFGLPSTLLEGMILVAFAAWFFRSFCPNLKAYLQRRHRIDYPFHWEIILAVSVAFIAAGISGFSLSALGLWKAYFFEPILLYILIFNVYREKKDWQKLFWAFFISATAVSLFAVFQKITGLFIANPLWQAAETRRAVSFFGYPNAVGLFLAPLIPLFSGWLASLDWSALKREWKEKIAATFGLILGLLGVYSARSTGALVGLAAGLGVFLVLSGKKIRFWGGLVFVSIVIIIFSYSPSRQFLANKLSFSDLSGEIRQQQWKETLNMLGDGRVWTGTGLNGYQAALVPYHQPGLFFNRDHLTDFDEQLQHDASLRTRYWQPVEIYLYPHNIILNFWSELGLTGLILFAWIILKALFLTGKNFFYYQNRNREKKYLTLGALGALAAIIIHGWVDVPYFKNDLAVMFWLFVALVGYLDLSRRMEQKKL